MLVDLLFPVQGDTIPTDHAYHLFTALSEVVPLFHATDSKLRFQPIHGRPTGQGRLAMARGSYLRLRLPTEMIGAVLPLAGKRLDLRGDFVRLGAPSVAALVAASALVTQLATFKNADNPETFLATARRKFDEMGIRGEPSIPLLLAGPRAGQPRRRVLRIRKRAIIGYKLLVQGLTAAESMQLQEVGLGGRRRMGCGFFLPVREET